MTPNYYLPVRSYCSSHELLTEDLCRKRWAALPELCCVFEGVGELQHAEVIAVAADDLDADRKPVGGEAGGD
jgi:hypothetical protein